MSNLRNCAFFTPGMRGPAHSPCTCFDYAAVAVFCPYGCFIAEIDQDSGCFVVSGPGCPLHDGSRHVVSGCRIHIRFPVDTSALIGLKIRTPRYLTNPNGHIQIFRGSPGGLSDLQLYRALAASERAAATAPNTPTNLVPTRPNSPVPGSLPSPLPSPASATPPSDTPTPLSSASDNDSVTASSSSSEAESDWQVYTYTSTPPSPTESEIDWVSVPSVPALQVNQDTSPPLDVDYDPYEEEDYMSQGPIDEDDEYYAYWTDHGEDDGDDDGDDNGNNNGGGDDNDDDDIDPNNNYWSIADQIRVLGETYDEYCEH